MKRVLLTLLLATLLAGLVAARDQAVAHNPPPTNVAGDGSVRISRLPFLAGTTVTLTTGWLGGSHVGQYATDWGIGDVTFEVYTASEGTATCQNRGSGFGFRVDLTRNDGIEEYYAHLPSCPFTGSKHFEQGDFLSWSGESGGDFLIHLHYEVVGTINDAQRCLSQFCDLYDSIWEHSPHHTFTSDNAGPGVGAPEPERGLLWLGYSLGGHNAPDCGVNEEAWDCYGSSMNWVNAQKAFRWAHGSPLDWAWLQAFQASDNIWHGLSLPDVCAGDPEYAYVVPDEYFWKWFWQADELGEARSSVILFIDTYYQFFRDGYMYSANYGKNPTIVFGRIGGCAD